MTTQDELIRDLSKTMRTVLECLRLQHKALEGYGRVLDNHEAALTRLMTEDERAATQAAKDAMQTSANSLGDISELERLFSLDPDSQK